MAVHITLDLIQEITRLDGTTYYDIANMVMNGRAELAAINGLIKEVRIIKLNIPHSTAVSQYEDYVSAHYTMPPEKFDQWVEWLPHDDVSQKQYETIIKENHIG